MLRIGVDTGGTFTDVVVASEQGIRVFKTPSTPWRPAQALLEALSGFGEPLTLLHGTTVATNAILEGKLARTALIGPEGHSLLYVARQTRPELYDLEPSLPRPPALLEDCFGVRGRLLHDGTELEPLRLEDIPDLSDFEAVAICLLFGYANPAHESRLRDAIAGKWPNLFVSCSHEVSPEFREYERAVATTLNAAVGPIMRNYLSEVARAGERTFVMMSEGGLGDVGEAIEMPVRTITSGPAAGVVAANDLGARIGRSRLIAFDMGGTSTDVSLINEGLSYTGLSEIAGLPARVHRIDVHTIGCGGGSIARMDEAGALRVGPQSAGADPGPAIYGRGEHLTVTDANYLLGRLPLSLFGGGSGIRLFPDRAGEILTWQAQALGRDAEEVAEAIVEVADAQMAAAVRKVSSARGLDPADFALVAYGGSGPLHACAIAEQLDMSEVVVPLFPGVFSAMGLLLAPEMREESLTVLGFRDASEWASVYTELDTRVAGFSRMLRTAEMRYRGQSHELSVSASGCFDDARTDFENMHERTFGLRYEGREVEWVSARVRGETPAPHMQQSFDWKSITQTPQSAATRFRWKGEWHEAAMLARTDAGGAVGPCIVVQSDSTTLLPPHWKSSALGDGTLLLRRA